MTRVYWVVRVGFIERSRIDPEVAECETNVYKHNDDSPITLRQVIGCDESVHELQQRVYDTRRSSFLGRV